MSEDIPPPLENPHGTEPIVAELYRHVPYDIEVEQALLGACLVANSVLDRLTMLKPEHFYDPLHQRLYEAICTMYGKGAIITPLTLHAALKADAGLIEVEGLAYLAGLVQAAPSIPNVRDLGGILRDLGIRRSMIEIGENIVNGAYEAPLDMTPLEQIEEAEKALYQISATALPASGPSTFANVLTAVVHNAERANMRGGRISGLVTGFADIDNLLGGLQPSDLIILAGRPGMGKTSLATNMAFHTANAYLRDIEQEAEVPSGAPVLFFSLEMAGAQLGARIVSEQTGLEMWKIRNGKFTDLEWEQFVLANQRLADLPLYIDDSGGITVAQIATRARRMKREKNIGCVVIDHIQLLEPVRRLDNRVQEVTAMSKALKVLAKELNIPVVALSQLSRGVDNRDDKRPVLSDLRESGSIEQDADVVGFLYREEYYLASREPEVGTNEHIKWQDRLERVHRRAELLVEKHRHGATAKIELYFDERFTRFQNLSEAPR